MAWQLDIERIKSAFTKIITSMACCDLCNASINESILFDKPLSQALLCQHCVNDLPYFNQELIAGNLLSWPAIHRALPNIHFDQLFSLAPYIYPFDHWLSQLKYSGRFEVAGLFGALLSAQWQSKALEQKFESVDLVLSVPLHVKKWRMRGYNQAHLIAKRFAEKMILPYDPHLLIRHKNNDCQMGKTGRQRRKNLADAFMLQHEIDSSINHVLLIDDVVTTGTTASEICKLLKQAGVETVTLVTVCLSLPKAH